MNYIVEQDIRCHNIQFEIGYRNPIGFRQWVVQI